MTQERVQKQKSRTEAAHTEDSNSDVTNAELAESTDDLLDAIEDVLEDQVDQELLADLDEVLGTEEEARAMVDSFVQKGGE